LEETMDPDISIWQKTGHFYFALTRSDTKRHDAPRCATMRHEATSTQAVTSPTAAAILSAKGKAVLEFQDANRRKRLRERGAR
jgi:hypothetical protein